jgi:hypothetical protein
MKGRNYGTMSQGYHYDEGKRIGYDITTNQLHFGAVAYHSKKQLIEQLVLDGVKISDIQIRRQDWEQY